MDHVISPFPDAKFNFLSVAVDGSDNAFLCGRVTTALAGTSYVGGAFDMVLIRVDSSNSITWTTIFGTSGADSAFGGK